MRIKPNESLFLIIDIQERLLPVMAEADACLAANKMLLEGLGHLGVPCLFSEQYPKGLGPTLQALRDLAPQAGVLPKLSFSCMDDPGLSQALEDSGRKTVILGGIEAHVCVLQTALDLLEAGYRPVLVADAVGSRFTRDRDLALERMARVGIVITSTESLLFELTRSAASPAFKEISRLAKQERKR